MAIPRSVVPPAAGAAAAEDVGLVVPDDVGPEALGPQPARRRVTPATTDTMAMRFLRPVFMGAPSID
jgi:hypothetical protein